MEQFFYKLKMIHIVPDFRKNKVIYWVVINRHVVDFLSNRDSAKRFAINFIDVLKEDDHQTSRKGWMRNYQNA